jgi:primosomal protein N' (replication factor Y)
MIAKVIVDSIASETDRPFDYLIPRAFMDLVQPGIRVIVPFGRRTLHGFVIDKHAQSQTPVNKLRPITSLLDTTPVLTQELLDLALWMSEKYVSPKFTSLSALLPGALKTKSNVMVSLSEFKANEAFVAQPELHKLIDYIRVRKEVAEEVLLATFADQLDMITSAYGQGIITKKTRIRDRLGVKQVFEVSLVASKESLLRAAGEANRRAPQQAKLLHVLMDQEGPWILSELLQYVQSSASAVKALEAKGLVRIQAKEVARNPFANRRFTPSLPLPLLPQQASALSEIQRAIHSGSHSAFLLHGVTGSGKTEVYLQAMQACLDTGRSAILLVPEISLTPQTVDAFMQRYGDRVAVMHSRLSQGEKYDEWRKMATQQVRIAIGARSAIFAPFTKIGLIIVDEEHESSYKQEESPKYHARDVALQRGLHHGATVVFGSATPSLESYFHAHKDLLQLLDMPSRVNGQPLPNVSVVDMRHELRDGNRSMFSGLLREAITRRLERGEQSVLLLNRRGYASFVLCRSCGFTVQCPHCEITLTYHLTSRHSRCHYCGYSEREVHACPSCGSEHIRHFGAGTQRVEEELTKLFPGIRSIRMDVDTTTAKGSHEKLLSTFRDRKADVLLGTQMIAKGLDFPHVTLVGVISADTMLRLPDFRATERTFQLLTQVSGRAGRHQLLGEVIVQTYTPEHYSIQYAANHDYRGFARKELLVRKELGYPPYRKLALATLSHDDLSRLVKVSDAFAKAMKQRLAESSDVDTELLGPVPSPIPKLKDRYRFQCVVKYREETKVREMLREITDGFLDEIRKTSLGIQIDIEPQVLL